MRADLGRPAYAPSTAVTARSAGDAAIQGRTDCTGGPWIAAPQARLAMTATAYPVKAPDLA